MAEHERRLVPVLGELGPEPRELVGRECTGVVSPAGLVVGVDPDDPQAPELAGEVGRLPAREELVVEAIVALPLADPARGVRVTVVGPIVIAPGDEVVAAIPPELLEQLQRLAQLDGDGFRRDVPGGEEVVGAELARVVDEGLEHHLRDRAAGREPVRRR